MAFSAADGARLAGVIARHGDNRPRPGIVLVPGMTQTKDLKFMVEVAELFARNGWHVLAIDLRGHGRSRRLSPALITMGWKETEDVIGAVRYLRQQRNVSSVAVMGFSMGGRSLVKAMARDEEGLISAGIAVTAPLAATTPVRPPDPDRIPNRFEKFVIDFLGTRSGFEYYDRAARSYGVDLATMQERSRADTDVARVKRPLLLLYALDDFLMKLSIRSGRHDGGPFSLAYRDTIRAHPHVRTMLVNEGNHAGMLYLSDPHWFGLVTLNYFKYWQARDLDYVTAAVPPVDILAEGELDGQTATYRLLVRNHGLNTIGPVDVLVQAPPGARLGGCWIGFPGLGRCTSDGKRLTWTIPRLPGRKSTAGPFSVSLDISRLDAGPFATRAWIATAEGREGMEDADAAAISQTVTLTKP
jgi:alpha-beta hydrolase superfamily lysophospholipase